MTPQSVIEEYLFVDLQRRKVALLNQLSYVGERCLNEARQNHTYTDRTGNLTGSLGYVILIDGKVHRTGGFDGGQGGHEGSEAGRAFVRRLIAEYPTDIVLIMVAGMKYAAYVSARRNVLDSAEMLAMQLIKELLG